MRGNEMDEIVEKYQGSYTIQDDTLRNCGKRKLFSIKSVIWLGVFLLLIVVLLFFTSKNSEAATIKVNDDGGADYYTIQEGLDAANPGDTVYVYNGTYSENVWISKTINLTGENKNNTTIDSGGSGDVINVGANYVNITGFNITKGYYYAGLELLNVKFCRIYNNRFYRNNHAIYMYSSSNIIIINNDVLNNLGGIDVYLSSDSIITNNNISSNREFGGVSLRDSSNITLISNNFTWDGVSVSGDQLYHYNSHTIPDNNIVNGKPLYYYTNCSGMDIDGIQVGQLIFVNCSHIYVRNLEIINTHGAIAISYSDNIIITGNDISNNSWGISIKSSSNCNLTNNYIFGGITGIYFTNSNNNIISNNCIQSAWNKGIFLSKCNYNDITDNTVSDSDFGIWLWNASFNNISKNTISSIEFEGIYLREACMQNIITENILTDCGESISHFYIRLIAITADIPPSNNIIYHNNFIDNNAQEELAFDDGIDNLWDNGKEGNYWSDYSGSDANGDGIGDSPYKVDSDTYDYYPLMNPYNGSLPPDTKPPYFTIFPSIIDRNIMLPYDIFQLDFTASESGHYEVIIVII
jgi:parallel beta-helix repeat protein